MNTQELMNTIYDILAQNSTDFYDRQQILELIDHVDTGRNAIVFKTAKGNEFELQLVQTYAPAESIKL